MSDMFSKAEVITGVARRRRFFNELKLALVAETMQPGLSVSYVARRHGLSPSLLFRRGRLMSEGEKEAARADAPAASGSTHEGHRCDAGRGALERHDGKGRIAARRALGTVRACRERCAREGGER